MSQKIKASDLNAIKDAVNSGQKITKELYEDKLHKHLDIQSHKLYKIFPNNVDICFLIKSELKRLLSDKKLWSNKTKKIAEEIIDGH